MLVTLRQRNFALLWFGALISQIGDWLMSIGLPVYVYMLTGSALQTSLMLIISYVPGLVLGSFAGVMVDRWDRRQTMLICNLLMALDLLPLLAAHTQATLWIVYVVQFVGACVFQLVLPAENALIPQLVGEDHLVSANSLSSISQNTARLLGGALGGLCIGLVGLTGVTLIDGATFLFVCVMLLFIRVPTRPATSALPTTTTTTMASAIQHFMQDWLEGMRTIVQRRTLAVLFTMFALQSIGEGVFGVLLIVFVEKVLGYGSLIYGSLMSFQAVGNIAGGLLLGQLGKRLIPARMLGLCATVFGLIDLLIIDIHLFLPGLFLFFFLFVLVGIPGTGMMVSAFSLLQSEVEDTLRGRIFGAYMTVRALMTLIGMALAGALGDRLGATLMLNIQGGVYALSGLFVLVALRSVVPRKQPASQETSELMV
ncbi:MAG TPA: MFS transporter [Ktedonobacteraceae bacterium]|nr:MFS transporter [Ktedonobacteraceae bacterium]